jgi:hypothetical protein
MFSQNVLDEIGSVCGLLRTEPAKTYFTEVRMTFSPSSRNSLQHKKRALMSTLQSKAGKRTEFLIEAYPNGTTCKLQYNLYLYFARIGTSSPHTSSALRKLMSLLAKRIVSNSLRPIGRNTRVSILE